jgi:CarD family transcriptional regulator
MFSLKEKVVYPGHGVAQVERIIEKTIGGCSTKFVELTVISTRMTVLVPLDNLDETGIRRISSHENIEHMFKLLEQPAQRLVDKNIDAAVANWSKKNKAYQCAIRTGDLAEVCRIYRELAHIAVQKELSFGEKNLLHKTESLLVEEISIATDTPVEVARDRLRTTMRRSSVASLV